MCQAQMRRSVSIDARIVTKLKKLVPPFSRAQRQPVPEAPCLCAAQDSPTRNVRLRGETTSAAAREVMEVKRQYDEAQLKNDSAWFERMFAEDSS